MSKKYKLTDETLEYNGRTLHRIVALKNFDRAKKGAKGGWVESENNLSQDGNCWVFDEAKVYEDALVWGNAVVYGAAKVYGEARVLGGAQVYDFAQVYGKAEVGDKAEVGGEAQVYDFAKVYGDAYVFGEAQVYGEAQACEETQIFGEAKVCSGASVIGNATLRAGTTKSDDDYVVIGPQGSRCSYTTYHIPSDTVSIGCFFGTLEEFEAEVKKTHKRHPKYLKQYNWVISVFNSAKATLKDTELAGEH